MDTVRTFRPDNDAWLETLARRLDHRAGQAGTVGTQAQKRLDALVFQAPAGDRMRDNTRHVNRTLISLTKELHFVARLCRNEIDAGAVTYHAEARHTLVADPGEVIAVGQLEHGVTYLPRPAQIDNAKGPLFIPYGKPIAQGSVTISTAHFHGPALHWPAPGGVRPLPFIGLEKPSLPGAYRFAPAAMLTVGTQLKGLARELSALATAHNADLVRVPTSLPLVLRRRLERCRHEGVKALKASASFLAKAGAELQTRAKTPWLANGVWSPLPLDFLPHLGSLYQWPFQRPIEHRAAYLIKRHDYAFLAKELDVIMTRLLRRLPKFYGHPLSPGSQSLVNSKGPWYESRDPIVDGNNPGVADPAPIACPPPVDPGTTLPIVAPVPAVPPTTPVVPKPVLPGIPGVPNAVWIFPPVTVFDPTTGERMTYEEFVRRYGTEKVPLMEDPNKTGNATGGGEAVVDPPEGDGGATPTSAPEPEPTVQAVGATPEEGGDDWSTADSDGSAFTPTEEPYAAEAPLAEASLEAPEPVAPTTPPPGDGGAPVETGSSSSSMPDVRGGGVSLAGMGGGAAAVGGAGGAGSAVIRHRAAKKRVTDWATYRLRKIASGE